MQEFYETNTEFWKFQLIVNLKWFYWKFELFLLKIWINDFKRDFLTQPTSWFLFTPGVQTDLTMSTPENFFAQPRSYSFAHSWGKNGTGVSEQNCPFGVQGTNYCLSCDSGYYLHNIECLEFSQLVFYQNMYTTTIYKYGIKPSGEGLYLDQFELQ